MKLQRVEISNFRSFEHFDHTIDGQSLVVVGENGGGKSSLLTAIARAMGRDVAFGRSDFRDPTQPITLRVTLSDFAAQQGVFAQHAVFGPGGPTLTVEA